MRCLDNIIGITQSTCECTIGGLTAEQLKQAKASTSGLYLDANLEGGVNFSDIQNIDYCDDYFSMATKAIAAATKVFSDDIVISVEDKYKTSRARFMGELGRIQYAGFISGSQPLQYLRVEPTSVNASVMVINGIRLNTNTSRDVVVKLVAVNDGYSYGDVVLETKVTTQANRFVSVALPEAIKVPFSKNGKKINYFFVWEKENDLFIDNSVSCGCSGGDAYDGYIKLSGGEATDYDNLGLKRDKFAHGFSLDVEMFCDTSGLVCSGFKSENRIALVTAWAILYKAGEILIESVLNSSEINRFTMMNREYLYGKRNHYRAEYNNRINYLGVEIDITSDDCFVCRENRMFIGSI